MVTWVTLYLPCHCTSERPQQLWVYKSYQFKKILNTLLYQSLHMENPSLYWDGVQIPWQMMQNIDIPRANITLIRHSSAEVTIKYRAGVHELIIDSSQIRHELGFRKIFSYIAWFHRTNSPAILHSARHMHCALCWWWFYRDLEQLKRILRDFR